jgi:hypothetical protein
MWSLYILNTLKSGDRLLKGEVGVSKPEEKVIIFAVG